MMILRQLIEEIESVLSDSDDSYWSGSSSVGGSSSDATAEKGSDDRPAVVKILGGDVSSWSISYVFYDEVARNLLFEKLMSLIRKIDRADSRPVVEKSTEFFDEADPKQPSVAFLIEIRGDGEQLLEFVSVWIRPWENLCDISHVEGQIQGSTFM